MIIQSKIRRTARCMSRIQGYAPLSDSPEMGIRLAAVVAAGIAGRRTLNTFKKRGREGTFSKKLTYPKCFLSSIFNEFLCTNVNSASISTNSTNLLMKFLGLDTSLR